MIIYCGSLKKYILLIVVINVHNLKKYVYINKPTYYRNIIFILFSMYKQMSDKSFIREKYKHF